MSVLDRLSFFTCFGTPPIAMLKERNSITGLEYSAMNVLEDFKIIVEVEIRQILFLPFVLVVILIYLSCSAADLPRSIGGGRIG